MKLREPDSTKLVLAFGANIFYDEFCDTHQMYTDAAFHLLEESEDIECVTRDVPTIRCPVCKQLVMPDKWFEHQKEMRD